jgi:hypothetical protein
MGLTAEVARLLPSLPSATRLALTLKETLLLPLKSSEGPQKHRDDELSGPIASLRDEMAPLKEAEVKKLRNIY